MSKHTKEDINTAVTDTFAAQCRVAKSVADHLSTLSGEELIEAMSPQMFTSLSKFVKDNEMRIQLSDHKDAEALRESQLENIANSFNLKFA